VGGAWRKGGAEQSARAWAFQGAVTIPLTLHPPNPPTTNKFVFDHDEPFGGSRLIEVGQNRGAMQSGKSKTYCEALGEYGGNVGPVGAELLALGFRRWVWGPRDSEMFTIVL
jgi:hypothetical protein